MARKHGGKPKSNRSRAFNNKDSSIKRWNKPEDIPMDEEDRFHASRDQILLSGTDHGSDDEDGEDEVFALKGMPSDSDEDSEDDDRLLDDDDPYKNLPKSAPKDDVKKSKKDKKKRKPSAASSDEEEEESEEEEGWGGKKSEYYASNDAQIDSEDEEANEMEEQEAKRLQTKARDALADDDFGLGDVVEGAAQADDDILEELPAPVTPSLPQDKESLLRHLEKTNPETLALARDWDDTARMLIKTQERLTELDSGDSDGISLGMNHLHYQALLTYATTLAFYLHLRSLPKYNSRPDLLKSHPIMDRLLTLKQSLVSLEDIGVGMDVDDWSDDDYQEGEEEEDLETDAMKLWKLDKVKGLDQTELKVLLEEAKRILSAEKEEKDTKGKKKTKKSKATAEDVSEEQEARPKKKRKTSSKSSLPVFDLEEPTFPSVKSSSKKPKSPAVDTALDPYGESLTLQPFDAQDKSARRKSLRFHTAKIESTINRRDRARRDGGGGGDDDIPWKERRKEKEERVKREIENARKKQEMEGVDLDDIDPESEVSGQTAKGKRRRDEDEDEDGSGDESGDDGYYELIKKQSKAKKEKKKAEYDTALAVEKAILMAEEAADGPRSLTRAILKNRGLTPHRSKSVRNPRVKKRQKYDKAKKKVSSQKAVYKGGLAAVGKYQGEKSGITKVVKSVRL